MLAIAIVLSLAITGASEQEDWPKVLREAQAKSKTALKEGRATMELTYTPPKSVGKADIVVQVEIEWFGENVFQKYRYFCPYVRFPMLVNLNPIETSPWNYRLRTATEFADYNATGNTVDIKPVGRAFIYPLLEFHPWHIWLAAFPPHHFPGRPWSELIDFQPRRAAAASKHEYLREGDDRIKHIRRDANGLVLETVFSLSQGGNLISLQSMPTPAAPQLTRGTYNWRNEGSAFVVELCEIVSNSGQGGVDNFETYHLKLKSIVLEPVPLNVFTVEHLMTFTKDKKVRIFDSREPATKKTAGP